MTAPFDTVMVLIDYVDKNCNISPIGKTRLDVGLLYWAHGSDGQFTVSGGAVGVPIPQSSVMAGYARSKGIPDDRLVEEPWSLDTVGQAVFSRHNLVPRYNWGDIAVVSCALHLPRVKAIFDKVYGPEFKMEYIPAMTTGHTQQAIDKEPVSLRTFQEQFGDIKDGDLDAITNRLFERHGLYKGKERNGFLLDTAQNL
jgi:hypothetical protein